jgi:protein arginine N-methyltransferase 1
VYAIDSRPMIHLARDVAAANGCADRIEFIRDDSRRVTLPERADVIVCDATNVLPEFQVPIMIDARRRLLASGGTLIPGADRLCAAVVHSPLRHEELVGVWTGRPLGLNLAPAHRRSSHAWLEQRFAPDEPVTAPACWATLEYHAQELTDIAGTLDTAVARRAVGHGLSVWVEADLPGPAAGGRRRLESLSPDLAAFFPWPEAVDLLEGDRVIVTFEGRLAPHGYHWRWRTTVATRSGSTRAAFDQDTARHAGPARSAVARPGGAWPPARGREALQMDRRALAAMDRGLTIGAIADDLLDAFPRRFASRSDALTYAGALAQRYG